MFGINFELFDLTQMLCFQAPYPLEDMSLSPVCHIVIHHSQEQHMDIVQYQIFEWIGAAVVSSPCLKRSVIKSHSNAV